MSYSVIIEIAKALGKHRTSINRRAIKEAWPYYEEAVNGGFEKRFSLNTLPKDIQLAVLALRQQEELLPIPAAPQQPVPAKPLECRPPANRVSISSHWSQL